ncbi:MAG: hypothetical protein HYV09_16110 [Deltaproteobacteria bacterium]|nr:hypothetical protein [Deltaproteobacteria bacterium]
MALWAWGCAGGEDAVDGVLPTTDGSVVVDTSGGGGGETSVVPEEDSSFNLDGSSCKPKTCAELDADCGPVADGCGGLVDCGPTTCPKAGEICGGGGPSKCGVADTGCKPKTCIELDANCGKQGDGCGNLIDCGTCTGTDTCGAVTPNKCGTPPKPPCTPKTCTEMAYNCGPVADGCGGLVNCGSCTTGTCGGGGKPNVCGTSTSPCVKKTCADWGADCGQVSDGCGGLTASCGTCTGGNICGGGGVASKCGGAPPPCTPKTCTELGANCGQVSDGCGGLTVNCGTCPSGQTCGGAGVPSVCGGPPPCVKKTCADYPTGTCGQVSDGCGGLTADCGGCTSPAICGGGGVPSKCGGGGGTSCVNLECKQVTCSGGLTSSISGKVYDPAGVNPLYNVFVYIPNGTPTALSTGATCDKCASALSGYPLVQTVTDETGSFKLTNVPVGTDIPLVIQTGKWRRQVTITTRACMDTPIDKLKTSFPKKRSEGDIPQFAISTGSQDNLECLLRKIGIDDSEFVAPSDSGRVHMYTGFCDLVTTGIYTGTYTCPATTCPSGSVCESSGPNKGKCVIKTKVCGTNKISRTGYSATLPAAKSSLWNSVANLANYDAVLLDCEGGYGGEFGNEKTGFYKNMFDYAGMGGRVFAGHYHFAWVKDGPTPWPSLATWNLAADLASPTNGTVLTGFPKGLALSKWLVNVGASTTPGILSIQQAQHSIDAVDATRTTNWITAYSAKDVNKPPVTVPSAVQYFSFNAPVGVAADSQCGRVVVTDIHVDSTKSPSNDSSASAFPGRCGTGTTLTAQQKALEFMIFDLGSRVCDEKLPPPPPTCTKRTCAEQGIECGSAPDGCGGTLTCGTCPSGMVCGTGGKCAGTSCTPTTCAALGVECGSWSNGCGGILTCGTCTTGTCGGGGVPGKCGGATCTPKKCSDYGYECGSWADGCGTVLNCGTCTPPATCGGLGVTGKCGYSTCTKKTCAEMGVSCGMSGDGCGGTQDCGACDGGVPTCTPLTCGGRCGPQGDGCGGVLTCPACPGGTCTKTTCEAAGAECGSYPDGCGGLLDCGTCVAPKSCGAAGPNKCGTIG